MVSESSLAAMRCLACCPVPLCRGAAARVPCAVWVAAEFTQNLCRRRVAWLLPLCPQGEHWPGHLRTCSPMLAPSIRTVGLLWLLAFALPAPAADLSGSAALTSDYVFRGISQSDRHVAPQGGLRLDAASGMYTS